MSTYAEIFSWPRIHHKEGLLSKIASAHLMAGMRREADIWWLSASSAFDYISFGGV
ncbi:hypothetical protein PAE61_09500 [Paracoccus aerodenitrificans]|nr:hypothetical protein PAE61_09500 [Paracoccus aerodenitrificans]